ncbi:thiamine-monophosphate kinase [Lucifera butyrica]|uniref:Thiamine-monophosphate kinase n=1 Tax=Lucifera butyrica TaxID=1351585 RepID=A0A498R354_9FIRM|nr:thiamine-phosphate kinase [Lucifera butyrica]VBB05821.1 thiamine-monophosphate kinase [Lucifera butyrica]
MLDLKQLGEFGLIQLISENTIQDPGSVVAGIGDDAAVLLPAPGKLQLLTADMLVENVHFTLATTSAWQLGYKSMAVNLSDIAAMGGIPKHAVVSIALPRETETEFVVAFYQGMKEICREFAVNIVGGDTVSSPQGLIINVTVSGEVEPANLIRRSGAQVGDLVAVTGALGSSGAGLDLLLRGDWEKHKFAWPLITAHLTPRPQVRTGRLLAMHGVTSMDDISDGLASEANEIADASKVGMRLTAGKIPVLPEIGQAGELLQKDYLDYALYGGEDYELIFTINPDKYGKLAAEDLGVRLTVIGEVVTAAQGVTLLKEDGRSMILEPKGYNHFR